MLFIESKTTQLIGYHNHYMKLKMSHDDYTYIIMKREGLPLPFIQDQSSPDAGVLCDDVCQ